MYIYECIYIYVEIYICIYIYIYRDICIYIYVYIYISVAKKNWMVIIRNLFSHGQVVKTRMKIKCVRKESESKYSTNKHRKRRKLTEERHSKGFLNMIVSK